MTIFVRIFVTIFVRRFVTVFVTIFVRIFVRIVVSLGENICDNCCLPRGEEGSSSAGALRRLHLHHLLLPSSKGKKNFDTLIMRVKD